MRSWERVSEAGSGIRGVNSPERPKHFRAWPPRGEKRENPRKLLIFSYVKLSGIFQEVFQLLKKILEFSRRDFRFRKTFWNVPETFPASAAASGLFQQPFPKLQHLLEFSRESSSFCEYPWNFPGSFSETATPLGIFQRLFLKLRSVLEFSRQYFRSSRDLWNIPETFPAMKKRDGPIFRNQDAGKRLGPWKTTLRAETLPTTEVPPEGGISLNFPVIDRISV